MDTYTKLRKFDEALMEEYGGFVLGVDEVGMGAWAGPAMAGALILKSFEGLEGVDDCKKLSPKQRLDAYEKILPNLLEYQDATGTPNRIDSMNVYHAGAAIRWEAIEAIRESPAVILIDGNSPKTDSLDDKVKFVIKADTKSLTVAAASILVKVSRDSVMTELAKAFPEYGWEGNKGYHSEEHVKALKDHGLTPYHRLSFKPIAKIASELERKQRGSRSPMDGRRSLVASSKRSGNGQSRD